MYTSDLILVKLALIVTTILHSYGFLPAVALTFELLTLKFNQHIYEPKYTRNENLVKFASLVCLILCSQYLRVIACCDPRSNQCIYEPKYICDQNWLKFPSLVFDI